MTTISRKGDITVWVRTSGAEQVRMSVMLAADADGNKFDPVAVLKRRSSSVEATQTYNNEHQYGFGRGVWREVT